MIICGAVFLVIARNFFVRDYTRETKTFLTSIGRADAIDNVVPKTLDDMRLERKNQLSVFKQLVVNMSTVMTEYKGLRADMDRMKAIIDDKNSTENSSGSSATAKFL